MITPLAALLAVSAAAATADREVVRVNGTPILQSEVMERLWKRYGPQTLEEMVDETLLRQAAAARKISPDEAEVTRRFKRLESQFGSRELFLSQLEQAGTSAAKVKADLAEEVVREKLVVAAKGLKVSDAELKKAFEDNKDKLGKPEAVHLRHILVKTEAEAKDIAEKVKGGADFTALAREKSLAASGKAAGGDYGFINRGMLPPEIDEVAFSLKDGELKVVPGPRGQHLLQVLARRPASAAKFDEVKDDLRELLLAEKIKEASPDFIQELRRKAEVKSPDAPARR
jgi:foldase protein PrsA